MPKIQNQLASESGEILSILDKAYSIGRRDGLAEALSRLQLLAATETPRSFDQLRLRGSAQAHELQVMIQRIGDTCGGSVDSDTLVSEDRGQEPKGPRV